MNNRILSVGKWVAVAALPLFMASQAYAQATRTWVSGVGDDVNPCSRTAPCKTFAGAISKTATGGEISVLDPGGFGTLTITKAITLNGDGTLASILSCGTVGISVNAQPNDVVIIRNLSINGCQGTISPGTNGITFNTGGELHVENVKLYGFNGQGIMFAPSAASGLFVDRTTIRNAVAGAIYIQPTSSGSAVVTLSEVSMHANGRGVRAEDGSTVIIRKSHAVGNVANGFVGIGTSRNVNMTLEDSVSAGNGATGVYAGALTSIKISNTLVTNNNAGLQAVGGGGIVSFGNNRVYDNAMNNGPPSSTPGQM
jgi:Right handed beta helix region